MTETCISAEAMSRDKLSPALLAHAASGQNFLGFLSYRRGDGLPLARWLRDRITSFKPPVELQEKIGRFDQSVGGAQNRAFLDMSYQKPNVDFWDEHIAASLCRSRTMILLQTPSVFQRLDNGEPNWCEREIETFLNYSGDPSRILVVMGPGAPIDRFPEPLAKISARWDWIDLRFFSQSPFARFRHGNEYDPQVAKVLAKIFDIADGELPILNREFARARARARRNIAAAAGVTMAGLSGLTVWALRERAEALRQRNAALVSQSRFLAKTADGLVDAGTTRGAVAVLRQALPDPAVGRERPLVSQAITSAYRAIFENRERGRLPMPDGASAVTATADGETILIASAEKLFVRQGLTTEGEKIVANDFGAPKTLVLSPDASAVLLISASGEIGMRALDMERTAWRAAGLGPQPSAYFLDQGRRLLLASAARDRLVLFDSATGRQIAARDIPHAANKPPALTVDAQAGRIFVAADAVLTRLSAENLEDGAQAAIDATPDCAMALSSDKSSLYVAVAQQMGKGRILELDAENLTQKRSFGTLAWGAKSVVVASNWHTLAVHGLGGVDFFDTKTGERLFHVVANFPMTGGRFGGVGDSAYFGFGSDGTIRRWTMEIGTDTGSYRIFDGGAIEMVTPLKDGSGFLSLSNRPSIVNWAFDPHGISREMSTPAVAQGHKLGIPAPIAAFDIHEDAEFATAAYFDRSVRRWDLNTGAAQLLVQPTTEKEAIVQVVTLKNGVTLVGRRSGVIEVYSEASSDTPLATLNSEPLADLNEIGASQAFAVAKSGAAFLLDASQPTTPRIEPLKDMRDCAKGLPVNGYAVCVDRRNALRIVNVADGGKLVAPPPIPSDFVSLYVTQGLSFMAASQRSGHTSMWRQDGTLVRTFDLTSVLTRPGLEIAARVFKLPESQAAAIRDGAQKLELPLPALNFAISKDGRRLAAAMFLGGVKLIDVETGAVREFRPIAKKAAVQHLAFSTTGSQLAAVVAGEEFQLLAVYDFASGEQIASIGLHNQANPELYALANGHGFVTIDSSGRILIHPVFEEPGDFIAFLAKEFPTVMTPEQKRFFFIE